MADCKFLPVDALALQQLKRAQTAHSNFIANNSILPVPSNRPEIGSNCFQSLDFSVVFFFVWTPAEMSGRNVAIEPEQRVVRPLEAPREHALDRT